MTTRIAPVAACLALLAAIAVLFGVLAPPAEAQLAISKEYKYTGTGSCAASSCHGGKKPAVKPGDPDDTYTIWAAKDKHNKAYNTLTKKESVAIAQKMKLGKATESDKCLGCHALHVDKAQLTPRAKYDVGDGVSCDSCHGPAEKWLEGHDKGEKGGWPHPKSVAAGMYDTKDVLKRAELCVSCHLSIDADMIAAGHPSMIFELDSFSQNQPPHWKDQKEFFGPLAWGTGQAAALREAAEQLATRLKGNAPEALLKESFDQTRGHAISLRPLLAQVAAEQGKTLEQQVAAIDIKDKAKGAAAASTVAKTGADLAKRLSQVKYTKDIVWNVLKAQVGDPERATSAGLRSAEQVAMAVDSLFRGATAAGVKPPEAKAIDAAIGKMFDELPTKPADFDPKKFTANLQNVAKNIK